MKEMWELEMQNYSAGEKAFSRWCMDNDYIQIGDDAYTVSYVALYEFFVDVSNLTAAQIYDFQDMLHSINEDEDAFISGVYFPESDEEVDADYFIYRRWISDEEFDDIFSLFKDYERIGISFIYKYFFTKKVYTEVTDF